MDTLILDVIGKSHTTVVLASLHFCYRETLANKVQRIRGNAWKFVTIFLAPGRKVLFIINPLLPDFRYLLSVQ